MKKKRTTRPHYCQRELEKRYPDQAQAQDGALWICSCGKVYRHMCDEAEGCYWTLARKLPPGHNPSPCRACGKVLCDLLPLKLKQKSEPAGQPAGEQHIASIDIVKLAEVQAIAEIAAHLASRMMLRCEPTPDEVARDAHTLFYAVVGQVAGHPDATAVFQDTLRTPRGANTKQGKKIKG